MAASEADNLEKFDSSSLSLSQKAALGLIRIYQLTLSPWIGRQCRFYPSCSHYAAEAISTHGFLRGIGLGAKRLAKCHPFHPGGVDLVPPSKEVPCAHNHANHN